MIKASHPFSQTDQKIIERIIDNEHLALNHMVLPQGEALPEHFANSNVYMIVLRGKLTVVADGEEHVYPAGSVVEIDYKTKMFFSARAASTSLRMAAKSCSPVTFLKAHGSADLPRQRELAPAAYLGRNHHPTSKDKLTFKFNFSRQITNYQASWVLSDNLLIARNQKADPKPQANSRGDRRVG